MLIGIDFDNTIISYDDVFLTMARARGLIDASFHGRKQMIRDWIRQIPDGELAWQRLQGKVYGKGISGATMFDGVDAFLRRCRAESVTVMIVSHKTEFAHHDPDRINLREAARDWMTAQGFFRDNGYAIPPENVYFEGTRQDKLKRIARLGCSHFIDDLEEVLADPDFPSGVERILFTEGEAGVQATPYAVCPTWQHIEERVFRARA